MIGLVIGLIATLVITNVFSKFEQQKRVTTGGADAQTNGSIALYTMRREIENAGYGLPVFTQDITPLRCPIDVTYNHDNTAGTPEIGLSPVVINEGGANSDNIIVHYGSTMKSGAYVDILTSDGADDPKVQVSTTLGCTRRDTALIIQEISATTLRCALGRVSAIDTGLKQITVNDLSEEGPSIKAIPVLASFKLACLGAWNETNFEVKDNQLMRTGGTVVGSDEEAPMPDATSFPVVSDIVSIQAQYGVSQIDTSNTVTEWVDAMGIWSKENMTVANRNRIKAVRVAVVARSPLRETAVVSQSCDGGAAGLARVCVWNETTNVNLATDANWQNYRYRVYETIVPLRNVMWNRLAFCGGVPC